MAIEVQNLNVHIKDNHILKNINLTLPEKQITCIIGPSGCGKSTLLRTLNRLIDGTEGVHLDGKVLVDGQDIIGSGPEITELRRRIGLVSQRPSAYHTPYQQDAQTPQGTDICRAEEFEGRGTLG